MAQDPLLQPLEDLLRSGSAPDPPEPDEAQLRAAVTVLLVQVVRADALVRHDEHRALEPTLQRVLGLSEEEASALVRHGEDDVARGVLFRDVVAVASRCSADTRKKIVHALWRVAYADAELEGREEYLVRKIAEHLQLSTADLVETKLRAREEFLKDGLR
ncbi:MAG TPA: TerB family tellurite resistance protein [Vicinamibacteria bacterium]